MICDLNNEASVGQRKDDGQFQSLGWHKQALHEAEKLINSGEARFSDWEHAKRRIRRKALRCS